MFPMMTRSWLSKECQPGHRDGHDSMAQTSRMTAVPSGNPSQRLRARYRISSGRSRRGRHRGMDAYLRLFAGVPDVQTRGFLGHHRDTALPAPAEIGQSHAKSNVGPWLPEPVCTREPLA